MKTLEEVKKHLHEVGYTTNSACLIRGFLIGAEIAMLSDELVFKSGLNKFTDFLEWYVEDEEEKDELCKDDVGFGTYLHVQGGIDVIVLSNVYNNEFVALSGKTIVKYVWIEGETRLCTQEEADKIDSFLQKHDIVFCPYCEQFEPFQEHDGLKGLKEDVEALNELNKTFQEMLGEEKEKYDSEYMDALEEACHEAIDNIASNFHCGNIDDEVKDKVVDALKVLVELGKTYE